MAAVVIPFRCRAQRALRASFPQSNYAGPAVTLFRGTSARECGQPVYGVSWTTRLRIARMYAGVNEDPIEGSVAVEATAAPDAVLRRRKYRAGVITEFYGENGEDDEFIVDPWMLTGVTIVRRQEGFICGFLRRSS